MEPIHLLPILQTTQPANIIDIPTFMNFLMECFLHTLMGTHKNNIMTIEELYLIENIIKSEDEHLESGDNPDERDKRKENAPEDDDNGDRDLESGDNPDERRKGI